MPLAERDKSPHGHGGWVTAITSNTTGARERVGAHRYDDAGRCYVYVRTRDALTIGQCVRQSLTLVVVDNGIAVNQGSGWTASQTGALPFDTYGSALPTNAVDALQGWYLSVNQDVAAWGDTYRIVSNTTTTVTLDRVLDAAVADDAVCAIWSPWTVELAGGSGGYATNFAVIDGINDPVSGIAVGTLGSTNYGWVQTKGLCPYAAIRTVTAGVSASPGYVNDSTTIFSGYMTAAATAGTLVHPSMTGVETGTAAENLQLLRAAMNNRIRPVHRGILQASAATQPCPVMLDLFGLGD